MKIITSVSILVLILAGGIAGAYWWSTHSNEQERIEIEEVAFSEVVANQEAAPEQVEPSTPSQPANPPQEEPTTEAEQGSQAEIDGIPSQFNLAVPFTSQAPHANWALPYQEACEEASVYMVAEYFKGTPAGKINPDVADKALLELIAFEDDFLGYHLDTTAAETVQFMDAFFGVKGKVVENPTVLDIKKEIAAGRPVIVPTAGQQLKNPNFSGAGPLYHMFVIKGYTPTKFITNDPGTRNGENYIYDIDVVMNAMGDWNNGNPANGAKRVIFVSP